MPGPWEMNYGPYYESERRRREVGRRALGMPEVSPAVEAGELYGVEQARLGEKRQYMQQAITNWQNQQTIKQAKSAANQKMAGQAVTGGASLALGGYRLGKEVGLWGGEKAATGLTGGGEGALATQAGTGAVNPATVGSAEYLGSAGLGEGGVMQAVPELTSGAAEGIFGAEAVGGAIPGGVEAGIAGVEAAGAITETSLAAVPVVSGVVEGAMGTGVAATTAAIEGGVAATEAGILSASSIIGPAGLILGVAAIAVTTLMGSEKTVICTELHRQGLLDDETYGADSEFGRFLPESVLIGYTLWAVHIVSLMERSRCFTRLVSYLALPWAKEMSFRVGKRETGHVVGRILMKIGLPVCDLIGKIAISTMEVSHA